MSAANDAVDRPVTSIPYLHATPGSNNAYICLVGTHADKVNKDVISKTEDQLATLVKSCKAPVWTKDNDDILFAVDNTTAGKETEDPTANFLRTRIEEVAEERDIYELPITWMLLQLEIQQFCSKNNKSYITVEECIQIGKHTNLVTDETKIKSMLLCYHLLRVLIYFEEVPGLCDYVIVDHQWWFDKLSSLISITFHQTNLNFQAKQKLKREGILTLEIFVYVV